MRILRVVTEGWMRMVRSTGVVVAVWLFVLLASLPASIVMENAIRDDVGASLLHRELEQGLDLGWLEEFQHRQGGIGERLQPVRVSAAMWLQNLELWLSGNWLSEDRGLAALALAFLLGWILLQGGVVAHLVDERQRFEVAEFLASAGVYFLRFLRLALITGVVYYGLFRLGRWLFPAIEDWTRDVTSETLVLGANLGGLALLALLMAFVHLIGDFARIATVVEGRKSMLLASIRSTRRVLRHPFLALGVFVAVGSLLLAWWLAYTWLAPAAGASGWSVLVATFLVGQAYIFGRWALRVVRLGAEISLLESWRDQERYRSRSNPSKGSNGRN